MTVRVDKPRKQSLRAQLNDAGIRSSGGHDFCAITRSNDDLSLDSDGLCPRIVHCQDIVANKDDVSLLCL